MIDPRQWEVDHLKDEIGGLTAERDEAREEREAGIADAKDYMDIVRQRDALKFAVEAGEAAMQHLARLQADRDAARALLVALRAEAHEAHTKHIGWDGRGTNPLLDCLLRALVRIEQQIDALLEKS